MADSHGNVCIYSKEMQHPASSPKVIEEAPSSVLPGKHLKKNGRSSGINLVII
jgi:acetyl/propionyl-CoA carboxylase alpha subunit